MISLRTLRSEPRKLEGKLNVVRIGIQGSNQACGEALSWGSAVAPSQTVVRTELRGAMAPTMPNVIESPPDYAFWCVPHASPALTCGAGKRQTAPKDRSKSLIYLRKNGAGEGIRTLDPNLGKVYLSECIWCGRRDSNPHSQRETDFLTTSAFAAAKSAFVAWTVPSPWLLGRRRRPSSLYTFPQSRAWLGIGLGLEPVSVPRL